MKTTGQVILFYFYLEINKYLQGLYLEFYQEHSNTCLSHKQHIQNIIIVVRDGKQFVKDVHKYGFLNIQSLNALGIICNAEKETNLKMKFLNN